MMTIIASYPASWFLTSAMISIYYVRFRKRRMREGMPGVGVGNA
jgi:hypothetical protein